MARSNECAPTDVPILKIFSMKKPSEKNLAPKLHQISEKALMPTKKLITVVWSSIKRQRDQMNWNFFFNERAFGNKTRPKIISSQRESLNAFEEAYYCRVVKH